MRTILLFFLLFFCGINIPCFSFSDDENYAVSKIPANLLKDADAVVRANNIRFEIKNESSAVLKAKKVVTIFTKHGQHYGNFELHYNKFCEVEELEARILDADGEEIKELKGKDIYDFCSFSDYSLYSDNRVKSAELTYDRFPYTIEYSYEISYDGIIQYPNWTSQSSLDPVESSKFEVFVPKNFKLRYWCNRDTVKPVISENGRLYTWQASNLEGLSLDAVGEDEEDVAAVVYIAPANFEIEGTKGCMLTWKDFGKWCGDLYKGKDQLPETAVKEIKSLIQPADDTKQKITKLYKYMQSRTRYVNISLGIGRWQPFDAAYVYQHGYGDCKALSNFMVTILKEAGITAYPVLIYNGDARIPIITEFPSNQFNHVITCVPLEKDTLWLECTDQNTLPGIIGHDNENRSALMLIHDGGVIIKTPVSQSNQNTQIETANAKLSITGAEAEGVIKWTGNREDYIRGVNKANSPRDQEKWILGFFDVPDVKLKNFSLNYAEKREDPSTLNIKLSLPKYVTISANRLFFNPNMMERETTVPKNVPKRLSPIRFSYPYLDIDSIRYVIPEEYKVEALPKEVNLTSSFGGFSSKVLTVNEKELLYIRSLEVKTYSVPAENYNEYRKFFADIVKADKSQVVLIKK